MPREIDDLIPITSKYDRNLTLSIELNYNRLELHPTGLLFYERFWSVLSGFHRSYPPSVGGLVKL